MIESNQNNMMEGPLRRRGKEPEAPNDDELPVLSTEDFILKTEREAEDRRKGRMPFVPEKIEEAKREAFRKLGVEWNTVFEAIRKAPELAGRTAPDGTPLAEELIEIIMEAQDIFIEKKEIPEDILAQIDYQIPGVGSLRTKVRDLLGKTDLHRKEKE